MAFSDRFTITDHAMMGLSESPEDQHFLPPTMPCPQKHVAWRRFHYSDEGHPPIPFYACYSCQVVFRYPELAGYEKLGEV